ncbi:antigen identified by monoclonal antibody Ki-67, partial [Coemansia sp. RSA 2706]
MLEPKYGRLVIISRSGADGKAFPMHHSQVLIGRKETCDIRMQRPQVSKEHCVIRAVGSRLLLKSLGDNGTAVNNTELPVGQQRQLHPGDVITIVGRSLRYEQPRPSANAQTPPPQQQRLASLHRQTQSEIIRRPPIARAPAAALLSARRQPRDPAVARKFQRWNQHYDDDDDPFATGDSSNAFQRMAASVRQFNHSSGAEPDPAEPDPAALLPSGSPLRRTLSTGGPQLLHVPMTQLAIAHEPDSDEVPTEPEPESDSDAGLPPPPKATPKPPARVHSTPSMRRLLQSEASSAARKSVRFGPPLSPELFDT